jgi:hypothetical protein
MVMEEAGGDVGETIAAIRAYDPRVSLVRNNELERWELWRQCEDGVPRRVGHRDGTRVPHGATLVKHLAEHDTQRGYDPIKAVDEHNARVDAERDRVFEEHAEDTGDRLAFALGRDLGEPMQSGRFVRLGGD